MKVSDLRDEIQNKNLQLSRYKKMNIAIAVIIIIYLLFKFLFGFDDNSDWFGIRILIVIGIFIFGIVVAAGQLDSSTKLGKFIDSFINFLSPQDPKEALKLLTTYALSGMLILCLSLFGPWFTYEGDWTHEFDSYFYDTEYGHSFSDRYGLGSVKSVSYEYSEWGVYTTYSESTNYDDYNGFQNRQEIASTSLNLVLFASALLIISSIVCLYKINKNILNLEPKLKDLKKTEQFQKKILQFSNKLENLHSKNINLSSFNKKIEEINIVSKKEFNNMGTVLVTDLRFILYTYLTCCTAAIGIAFVACILFSQNWAEAMHTENGGDDGVCIVCENVDSFTGNAYVTEGTSSGTYYIDIFWGGGWGREIIMWLGTLTFMGIFTNTLALHNLSKASIKEVETLTKKSKEFKVDEFFKLV